MSRPTESIRLPFAGAAGLSLAAAWAAQLTVSLNPHLTAGARLRLLALFAVAGAVAGALGGLAAALLPPAARRLGASPAVGHRLAAALFGLLAFGPPLYALLLPDTGVAGHLLTDALFTPGLLRRALTLVVAVALLAGAGLALAPSLRRLPRLVAAAACAVLLAAILTHSLLAPSAAGQRTEPPSDEPAAAGATASPLAADEPVADPPTRVVLLVIDGADLSVIEPMVAAGELPTFARLMRDGTWGPLATLEPTLSPLVWTTLATGKPPAEHGVLHFTWFRLPWVGQPILTFPLHTGLNFRLFPWLERLPGPPAERLPYSSTMRRSEALWTIVGRRHPVGVFQWLVTWPAEEVPGFVVAGGFGSVQHGETSAALDRRAFYPRQLAAELPVRRRRAVGDAELRRYAGPGVALDRDDPRVAYLARTTGDDSGRLLATLIRRYRPALVAAGFYPVDGYHHHFAAARRDGGPFAPAIGERYRLTDRRLGELTGALAALPGTTNLVVVSDHGFDFEHGHHTWAPPGVLFAHGPAFAAGRRLDRLSVYDVAPLALHLVGLAVPLDMPGARSGSYRAALAGGWLRDHPVGRVASYEGAGEAAPLVGDESPLDDEIRDALKSLGYIR